MTATAGSAATLDARELLAWQRRMLEIRLFEEKVQESVARTGGLVIVEEQLHDAGWGASLISRLARAGSLPSKRTRVLSLADHLLIPYTPRLEDAVIPSVDTVVEAARSAVG